MSAIGSVVRRVLEQLPEGVTLADRAVVEYYPRRKYENEARVFAYQFMTTEGRNIATWIPDVSDEPNMQATYGSRHGRPYDFETHGHGYTRIDWVWKE